MNATRVWSPSQTLHELCIASFSAVASDVSSDVLAFIADEAAKLVDELGPRVAEHITRRAAREYFISTGLCPLCATVGVLHAPQEERES